ncbi:MAG: extracellular solute-binding protein [Zoogloeaceae bacterium]|nr:extracellular solute-binding protein [Zoogloeaceae bacterium]
MPKIAAVILSALLLFFASAALPAPAKKAAKAKSEPAVTEIEFAHQLDQRNAERLAALVERFNREQQEIVIRIVHAEAKGKPALLNLATPDTIATFITRKAAYKPISRLLKETKEKLPSGDFSPDLFSALARKNLTALPVAFSTPVLFYNKRMFREAGLDPERAPRTWREMQETAGRLLERGMACPYTSSWPVWIHIDNMSSVSNAPVADAKGKLVFNGLAQVKHVAMLASWRKSSYFHHFGRANEADARFHDGQCAMLTSDAWANSFLREAPGLELGVAAFPYHDDLHGAPQHTLAAGASLWVGGGYKAREYKAAARFLRFLMQPETQAELARAGGFLPLTNSVRQSIRAQLQKDEEAAFDIAYASLRGKGAEHPLRVSALEQVRIIADEELEQVWGGRKSAKAALDTAVRRGNAVLSAKPALRKAVLF